MQNLVREVRQATRSLMRERGFTATVTLTLGVAIAANTAMFAIVNSVLLRPLPVPNAERMVLLSNRYPKAGGGDSNHSGVADYYDRLEALKALEQQALFQPSSMTLEIQGIPQQVEGMRVTPSLFPLVSARAAAGRLFLAEEGEVGAEQKAVLTAGLARQLFGSERAAVGKEIRLGSRPFTVVGVMAAGFSFVNPEVRIWIPLAFDNQAKQGRHNNSWNHVGLVKRGRTIEEVQAQVDALNRANLDRFPEFKEILINAGFHTKVEPLEWLLVRQVSGSLYLLWGGAALVLLIGGINVTNLMLARASTRRREIACRAALGASRYQLARQLTVENLLLGGAGGGLGLALGYGLLAGLGWFGLDRFPRAAEVRIDAAVMGVSIGLALAAILIVGLAPLFDSWRVSASSALREVSRGGTSGVRSRRVRQGLVAAEIGFAFALLIVAGLLMTSFRNLLNTDPGFDREGVWTASTSAPRTRYEKETDLAAMVDRLLRGVRSLPGVKAAGITNIIPLGGSYNDSVIMAEGYQMKPGESLISPHQSSVTPGYFEAMGIDLVRGRYFDERDQATAPLAMIVDERLAQKFWPKEDPVGRRMRMPEDIKNLMAVSPKTRWFIVVGVVRSLRLDDAAGGGSAVGAYYFPYAQAPQRGFTLAVKVEGDPARLTNAVREELNGVDRELALFDVRTMAERGSLALASRRTALMLAAGFSAVAMFLAAIGVFGVLAYSVAERQREIGIRMALGSTSGAIARLVVREGMTLVGIGLALGAVGAIAMRRAIEQQVFGVGTLDPAVWAGVMALLAALAVAACGVPAMRAARVDPARVLSE